MNLDDQTVIILDRRNTTKTPDEIQSDVKTRGFDSKSTEIWLKRSLFFSTPWINKNIKHPNSTSNS